MLGRMLSQSSLPFDCGPRNLVTRYLVVKLLYATERWVSSVYVVIVNLPYLCCFATSWWSRYWVVTCKSWVFHFYNESALGIKWLWSQQSKASVGSKHPQKALWRVVHDRLMSQCSWQLLLLCDELFSWDRDNKFHIGRSTYRIL